MSIFEYNEELHMQQERKDAIQQGETLKLIAQIKKKKSRNLSPAEIADALEEELPCIQEILAVIDKYPGADPSELYELLPDLKKQ